MSQGLRVGCFGLGAMGEPMAGHLASKGLLTGVYNRSAERAAAFSAQTGVAAYGEPAALARVCNVLILCVSADTDVVSLFAQLEPGLQPGSVLIDSSTVSSATAQQLAERCAQIGVDFLDAPLTGGVEGARNARLSVMVGGAAEVLARVRPALEAFAARITLMGPVGSGQATKAVNQVMVSGIAQAVCEALAFAEALGLPQSELLSVLTGGAAQSWFLEKRGATMLNDQFAGGFKLQLLLKDLRIVEGMLQQVGIRSSAVQQSLLDYAALTEAGCGEQEISALIKRKRRKPAA